VIGAVMLAGAAVGAVMESVNASSFGRVGGVFAAAALVVVAVGVVRAWRWAFGVAFFLGLFWLWAVVALGIQGRLSVLAMMVWIAWSIVVMTVSVRART